MPTVTSRAGWRTLCWLALFVATAVLGRATRPDDAPIALVWPAAGVAVLWFLLTDRRRWLLREGPALGLAALAVNLLTGAPVPLAVTLAVANVVHAVAAAAVFARLSTRASPQLRDNGDVAALGAAALAGALASAPLSAGITAVDDTHRALSVAVLWVLRYAASTAVVLAFALAWLAWRADRRSGSHTLPAPSTAEVLLLLLLSLTVHAAVLTLATDGSLVFLTLPATVLVGWRLGAAWSGTHGLLVAAVGVAGNLAERGPFAGIDSYSTRAMLVQSFVAVHALVGLALSLEVQQRHAALRAAERRGRALEQTMQGAVVPNALLSLSTTTRGRVVQANPAMQRWLGGAAVPGLAWQDLLAPEDRETFSAVLAALADGARTSWHAELVHRLPSGPRWCEVSASRSWLPHDDEEAAGEAGQGVANVQLVDLTERKALERDLAHQALHDQLTGLPNRVLLRERVDHALTAAARSGRSVALVFLDLDRFKVVNDSLGHAAGDTVLVTVAGRLAEAVRPGDTVARLGGDEFVVCSPDLATVDDARAIAARLVEAAALPVDVAGHSVDVGVSAGVTVAGAGDDADALLRQSDLAMYEAKTAGRGRVEVFSPPLLHRATSELQLQEELREAVALDQFVLHYQPIVEMRTGRVQAVEALVRWQHPERGLLLPGDWLDVVEASGQMPELGARILSEASAHWPQLAHMLGDETRLHVNVSASQLRDGGVVGGVRAALAQGGLPPDRLVLELTETQLLTVRASLVEELESIRALGVRLAADDFGTGYSSLTQLIALPIDEVKIDRRFVAGMADEARSRAVVHGVVGMAQAMGLSVVAEGVESRHVAELLLRAGCSTGQGFLWGRPARLVDLRRTDDPDSSPGCRSVSR